MKAALIERPGVLAVREIHEPAMGPYDALCDILCGATCTGTDLHLIHGTFLSPLQYPAVLGHESVGRVIDVGEKVRHFKPGDVVTRVGTRASPTGEFHVYWGGFAERGIARDHWAMHEDGLPQAAWAGARVNQLVPADITPDVATMFTTWRETLSYITRMGVRPDNRLLVAGSGGVGLSFAAHAAHLGLETLVMIGSARRRGLAAQVGVTS